MSDGVTCRDCGLPAFREGLTFWCPSCDERVEITVPMQPHDERHVMPSDDLVGHAAESDCVCEPQCEPVKRDDGTIGWLYVHHSLDGREQHEPPVPE